jgi:Tfp pilus assembly pilus retraction ATPase PilT
VKIRFFQMLTDAQIRELEDAGEIDFMYDLPEVARFRINLYKKHVGLAGALWWTT